MVFRYQKNSLSAEGVRIKPIAEKIGTPFYLYSRAKLVENYTAFNSAFKGIDHLICFAGKANTNGQILKILNSLGSGVDVGSGGELYRTRLAGLPAKKIVFTGTGKTAQEINLALKEDILMFNVESLSELNLIDRLAGRMKKKARIAFRVNPDVFPGTHPHLTTGVAETKFGIDLKDIFSAYQSARQKKHIEIVGIHTHIGSQITDLYPFREAARKMAKIVGELQKQGLNLKYLDLGGGLGIKYRNEDAPSPSQLAGAILPDLKPLGLRIIFEPGRYIVGNTGILVTRVLYCKKNGRKRFVIVDSGMSDLIRPLLYDAYHEIKLLKRYRIQDTGYEKVDVVGPICETGDFLARDRKLPPVKEGDLLAVFNTGAYGLVMASNYNSRLKPAEVLVEGNKWRVIRERESYKDLVRLEE